MSIAVSNDIGCGIDAESLHNMSKNDIKLGWAKEYVYVYTHAKIFACACTYTFIVFAYMRILANYT